MNNQILKLHRELLLEQLIEVDERLKTGGFQKKGFTTYPNKKTGIYYVRDYENGKQIGNRSLGTTDKNEAVKLAEQYREARIKSIYEKKYGVEDITAFFADYYKLEKSKYLQEQLKRGERKIGDSIIKHYDGFTNNHWIPFLIENKIKRLNQITIKTLKDFQYCLIEKKNKKGERLLSNGTINDRIDGALKPIFTNLLLQGIIKTSPFIGVKFNLPESDTENRLDILPIYKTYSVLHNADIWRLYKSESDIIKNKIANLRHYKKYRLICLLSATCGLRDAEIFYLRKSYLIKIRRVPFLEIVNSHNPKKEQGLKTENSKRKVPVPTITLQALNEYIAENNITDYLFYSGSGGIHYNMFGFTKNNFACHCGYNEKEIADKNFDFYSFRHLYKSIFNGSGIDENIVEYFFGHKTDLRKMNQRYNNRESLDEEFFETFGLQVIEFIDDLFLRVLKKYDLLPSTYTHIEQVSLTDNKNITRNYYTEVLDDFSFEEEIYHILGGFVDKGLLKSLNDKNGLKELIETNQIDKKLFDDCIYYIENNKI